MSRTLTAREAIRHEYGAAKNFMTPDVIRVGKIARDVAYELSAGRGFDNEPIYGVSIVRILDHDEPVTEREYDLSGLFHSRLAAEERIADLTQRAHTPASQRYLREVAEETGEEYESPEEEAFRRMVELEEMRAEMAEVDS